MRIIDADALLDYLDEEQPENWTNSDAEIQQQIDWGTFKFMIDCQPTIRDIEDSNVYCGNCDKTDGLCYTSLPPKVKCTVTGEYHLYGDKCTVK